MAKKVAYMSMLTALALILGYVEYQIPVVAPVPGIKLGLSNIVVLLAIYWFDIPSAFGLMLAKVLLSGLLFGGMVSIIYSLSGALAAFVVMALCVKLGQVSEIGASVAGAIAHNAGQLAVAALVIANVSVFYYAPILLISGVITGILTGLAAKGTLKAAPPPRAK